MPEEDQLSVAVRKLVGQVAHWTPSRWTASSALGASRADVMHALVQWLADRSAEAEGRPPIPVPRLDNDLALPDQLCVVSADLLRFGGVPSAPDAAAQVNATKAALC